MTATKSDSKNQSELRGLLRVVLITLVVIGVVIGIIKLSRSLSGGDAGDECSAHNDCKNAHYCIEELCSPACKDDADCPSNWRCRKLSITRQHRLGIKYKAGHAQICRPASAIENSIRNSVDKAMQR